MPEFVIPKHTPWGVPDGYEREFTPGIIMFSTPSHGGFWVAPELNRVITDRFPGFKPWAGPGWYEEDSDWALVVICFPEHFTPRQRLGAIKTIRSDSDYWAAVAPWLDTPEGRDLVVRSEVELV